MGALSHIRICDFTGQLAGAGATRVLAAFGAQVIRIEDPVTQGRWDILRDSKNATLLQQSSSPERRLSFSDLGQMDARILAGHDTSPTTVDWNRDGVPDLLVGAEDGRFYYKLNRRTADGSLRD